MLFNSIEFLLFFPLTFIIYWLIGARNIKAQNLFIIVVSYMFYGWWDWRFLTLIAGSSILDYGVALKISSSEKQKTRRNWLWLSILFNLGVLGLFKYYGFFVENFYLAFQSIGINIEVHTLNIVLPVGISFYTFQTLSYTIDVYREKLQPTHDIFTFMAFVSFFPQLVAGPIERATNLIPQFKQERKLSSIDCVDGLRQMLYGFFKKMVIADSCATIVNPIYENPELYGGGDLLLASICFAFQIYCDFSGYSDIAIGTAKLFGFKLMKNFAFPYFSRDIAEFWRRWHISLSTWFRDYLYIPLGGSKGSKVVVIRNVFIIFIVSGFWHGANWTFLVWGFLNALYFLPLLILNLNRKHQDNFEFKGWQGTILQLPKILLTFLLCCLAWVYFRANDVDHAHQVFSSIFNNSQEIRFKYDYKLFVIMLVFILWEWVQKTRNHGLEVDWVKYRIARWSIYYVMLFSIPVFSSNSSDFIYFQF